MGVQPKGGGSLSRAEATIHNGTNIGPLRCHQACDHRNRHRRCDTWVLGYGGGGKDIVESGSIGLYSQWNNLRFVVSGCFLSVVSEDGESRLLSDGVSSSIYAMFLSSRAFFLSIDTPGIQSSDARPQGVSCVGVIGPDWF